MNSTICCVLGVNDLVGFWKPGEIRSGNYARSGRNSPSYPLTLSADIGISGSPRPTAQGRPVVPGDTSRPRFFSREMRRPAGPRTRNFRELPDPGSRFLLGLPDSVLVVARQAAAERSIPLTTLLREWIAERADTYPKYEVTGSHD